MRFNPSIGIGGFQTGGVYAQNKQQIGRFNPSIGIGGFQTYHLIDFFFAFSMFQSLNRDRGLSNGAAPVIWNWCGYVSIPQSG